MNELLRKQILLDSLKSQKLIKEVEYREYNSYSDSHRILRATTTAAISEMARQIEKLESVIELIEKNKQ